MKKIFESLEENRKAVCSINIENQPKEHMQKEDYDEDITNMLLMQSELDDFPMTTLQYVIMERAFQELKTSLLRNPDVQSLLHFYEMSPFAKFQRHLKEHKNDKK